MEQHPEGSVNPCLGLKHASKDALLECRHCACALGSSHVLCPAGLTSLVARERLARQSLGARNPKSVEVAAQESCRIRPRSARSSSRLGATGAFRCDAAGFVGPWRMPDFGRKPSSVRPNPVSLSGNHPPPRTWVSFCPATPVNIMQERAEPERLRMRIGYKPPRSITPQTCELQVQSQTPLRAGRGQ